MDIAFAIVLPGMMGMTYASGMMYAGTTLEIKASEITPSLCLI